MMQLGHLTHELIQVVEKAARIARMIRSEQSLFRLLIQEKSGLAKNDRFDTDFKTLADVLIQEMAKHHLTQRFPGLSGHIYGEESNVFENCLGRSIVMTLDGDEKQTKDMLAEILDHDEEASALLAQIVHSDVTMETDKQLDVLEAGIEDDEVGIWIDPIDSTAQYINGGDAAALYGSPPFPDGLQCVTVLIGAFHRHTGAPVAGVVCQPFSSLDSARNRWAGRTIWGVSHAGVNAHSCLVPPPGGSTNRTVVVSGADDGVHCLSASYHLPECAGAGYKILCVLDGLAEASVLTRGSTYKWDTCAPHAVLRAMGGGVVGCNTARGRLGSTDQGGELGSLIEGRQLQYHQPDSTDLDEANKWSNSTGFVAYRDSDLVKTLIQSLNQAL